MATALLTDKDGDKAFLVWKGKDTSPNVGGGDFQWTGGTGKYSGIKGNNTYQYTGIGTTPASRSCGKASGNYPEPHCQPHALSSARLCFPVKQLYGTNRAGVDVSRVLGMSGGEAGGQSQSCSPKPCLTKAWSRLPTASAPASLPLPAAAHARRSATKKERTKYASPWYSSRRDNTRHGQAIHLGAWDDMESSAGRGVGALPLA